VTATGETPPIRVGCRAAQAAWECSRDEGLRADRLLRPAAGRCASPQPSVERADASGAPNGMFPQWSHDGRRIVFTSDRDGDSEIYIMDADGANAARLTHAPGRDAHPFLSRDGRRMIFQSPRANGRDTNIFVQNLDGSGLVQLTDVSGFAGVPVYSPDETASACCSSRIEPARTRSTR
jgi:hypothetical protein